MNTKSSTLNLRNPNAYLAAIIESSDDAIISKDLNGTITSWNAAAERIFGFTAEEAIGHPITIIIPPDRQHEEKKIIERLKKGERIDHFETIRRGKDGRQVEISVTISPIRDDEGNIIGASKTARDISHQKSIETKLQEQSRTLERANRELEDIAHITSHDLKEPLRGLIINATFLLEDYADKLDEAGVKKLKNLVTLSHRSYQLINDLLSLSRAGQAELPVEALDPNHIIHDIGLMLEDTLKERNARIVVPETLPHFTGNKSVVAETFRNLITNGITYNSTPAPLVEIGFLSEKKVDNKMETNVFYVKDNGIGIDRRFHDDIFRLFKRLVTSKNYNVSGTGSGLALVKKMVERSNGRIWLESEVGVGSTFFFTLDNCFR